MLWLCATVTMMILPISVAINHIYSLAKQFAISKNLSTVFDFSCDRNDFHNSFAEFNRSCMTQFVESRNDMNGKCTLYEYDMASPPPINQVDLVLFFNFEVYSKLDSIMVWLQSVEFRYIIITATDCEHPRHVDGSSSMPLQPNQTWSLEEANTYFNHYFAVEVHKVLDDEQHTQCIIASPLSSAERHTNSSADSCLPADSECRETYSVRHQTVLKYASTNMTGSVFREAVYVDMDADRFTVLHKFPINRHTVDSSAHTLQQSSTEGYFAVHRFQNYTAQLLEYCMYHSVPSEQCTRVLSQVSDGLASVQRISLVVTLFSHQTAELQWAFTDQPVTAVIAPLCRLYFRTIEHYQRCLDELEGYLQRAYAFMQLDCIGAEEGLRRVNGVFKGVRGLTVVGPVTAMRPVLGALIGYDTPYSALLFNDSIPLVFDSRGPDPHTQLALYRGRFNRVSHRLRGDRQLDPRTIPRLHLLLVTTARRPQIFGVIASLQELGPLDHLTIVFDGVASPSEHIASDTNPSSIDSDNATDSRTPQELAAQVENYSRQMLECQLHFVFEAEALGYAGRAARQKHNHFDTLAYDFILHLDNDGLLLPGAIDQIRRTCVDLDTLYIFRMKRGKESIWSVSNMLSGGNVGTPNGVIPKAANRFGFWGLGYGGDADFYISLIPYVVHIKFVDYHIYRYGNTN